MAETLKKEGGWKTPTITFLIALALVLTLPNPASATKDYRIQNDSGTIFFIKGDTGFSGIGDDTPVATLDVGGGTRNLADPTGSLLVANDLEVDDDTHLTGTLDLNGDLDADVTTFYVEATDAGADAIYLYTNGGGISLETGGGPITATGGLTDFGGYAFQYDFANGDTDVGVGGVLEILGRTYVMNDMNITGFLHINGDLDIEGAIGNVENITAQRIAVGGRTVTSDTGNTVMSGYLDADEGGYLDNIQIGITGTNEIDTQAGNLILDSAGGTVQITDAMDFDGAIDHDGASLSSETTGQIYLHSGQAAADAIHLYADGTGGGIRLETSADETINMDGSIDHDGTSFHSDSSGTATINAASNTQGAITLNADGGGGIIFQTGDDGIYADVSGFDLGVGSYGHIDLAGGDLGVAGDVEIDGSLYVDGDFDVDGVIFSHGNVDADENISAQRLTLGSATVPSTTGSASMSGNLEVDGTSNLDTTVVAGSFSQSGGGFLVQGGASNGVSISTPYAGGIDLYAQAATGVIDIWTGGGEIDLYGGNVDIGEGTYTTATAAGDLGVDGDLEVNTNTDLDGNLDVDGTTTLDGLTNDGTFDQNGAIDHDGTSFNSAVTGQAYIHSSQAAADAIHLYADGAGGSIRLETGASQSIDFDGSIDHDGTSFSSTVGGNFAVDATGVATITSHDTSGSAIYLYHDGGSGGITIESNNNIAISADNELSLGDFVDVGGGTYDDISSSAGNLGVSGSVQILNDLYVDGNFDIEGVIFGGGNINASGTLVGDKLILGSGVMPASGGAGISGSVDIDTNLDVDGTSNLDNTDIDGTFTHDGSTFDSYSSSTAELGAGGAGDAVTIYAGALTGSMDLYTGGGEIDIYGGLVDISSAGAGGYTYASGPGDLGVDGQIESNTGGLFRDVKVGGTAANEIDTQAGNLILDSAGGTVQITDAMNFDGSIDHDGTSFNSASSTGNAYISSSSGAADAVQLYADNGGGITLTAASEVLIDFGLLDVGGGTYTSATGNGDVGIDGDLEVNTDTDLDGNLDVDGTTTLDATTVAGTFGHSGGSFSADGSGSTISITTSNTGASAIDIYAQGGGVQIRTDNGAGDEIFLDGFTDVGGGTYSDISSTANDLGVAGDLEVNGDVFVGGDIDFDGVLIGEGVLTADENVTAKYLRAEKNMFVDYNGDDATDILYFDGTGGSLTYTDASDDFDLSDALTVAGAITATGADVTAGGDVWVGGGTTYGITSTGALQALAGSVSNTELANSQVTYTAGNGLTGGGAVSLGSSATINAIGGTGITANADDIESDACTTTACSALYSDGDIYVDYDSSSTDNYIYFDGTDQYFGFQDDTDFAMSTALNVGGNIVAAGGGSFYTGHDLDFDGELLPDGSTCGVGQILKRTGADNWDCAADDDADGMDSFTMDGSSGTAFTVSDGSAIYVTGGSGLTSVADGSDTVALAVGAGTGISAAADSISADACTTTACASLYSDGDIYVNYDGPNGDSNVYFYETGATGQYIRWDTSEGYFLTSDHLASKEGLWVGAGTTYGMTSAGDLQASAGSVSNTELANSALTVTAGSGLTGGGSVSLGGSTTINAVDTSATNELQNIWYYAAGNSGTAEVDSTTDTLEIYGAGISNVVCSDATDRCTITSTEVDGSTTNELQTLSEVLAQGDQSTANQDLTIYDGYICADNAGTCAGTTDGYVYSDAIYVAGGTTYGMTSGGALQASAGSVSNTELANSALTVTAGNGLSGGGSISLGSSGSLAVNTGTEATTGLTIASDQVRLMTTGCTQYDVLRRDGTNTGWECADDDDEDGMDWWLIDTDDNSPDTISDGEMVSIDGGSGITTSYAAGVVTVTAADTSATNEIQNIFASATGNSGTATADSSSDALSIFGAGISNVVCSETGDRCTITSTEVDGSTTNEMQNLFSTVAGDTGSAAADGQTDTLTLTGSGIVSVSCATSPDACTITAPAGSDNQTWDEVMEEGSTANIAGTASLTTGGSIELHSGENAADAIDLYVYGTSGTIQLRSNSGETLENDPANNQWEILADEVGVGTSDPKAKLHISDTCSYGGLCGLCVSTSGTTCDNENIPSGGAYFGDDVESAGDINANGKICGNRYMHWIYGGYTSMSTGSNAASKYTSDETEGKTYTCMDCWYSSGTSATCSTGFGNAWYRCEFKVTCVT